MGKSKESVFANAVKPNADEKGADGEPSDAAIFLQSLQDQEIIERVRATIMNAHVFKLPPKQSASVGWRGADWKEKVWQGTVKVVERGDLTAVLLVDKTKGSIFAVCPVKEGAVDRCVDSSRYFVLRIENANGRHMFIGVAFNERNDAFDFNTAMEDSKREREQEKNPTKLDYGPPKDYSIKDGEKIKVSIPKNPMGTGRKTAATGGGGKSFLKPSPRDTVKRDGEAPPPSRSSKGSSAGGVSSSIPPVPKSSAPAPTSGGDALNNFFDSSATDPFPAASFGDNNFFAQEFDNESTGASNPFFKNPEANKDQFDPRNYKTESGR